MKFKVGDIVRVITPGLPGYDDEFSIIRVFEDVEFGHHQYVLDKCYLFRDEWQFHGDHLEFVRHKREIYVELENAMKQAHLL